MRNQIREVLQDLNYDFHAFSIDGFIEHVQRYRQRRMFCQPYRFAPGISGAWIKEETTDFVIFQRRAHLSHQIHIILHEVAHMLLQHPLRPIKDIMPPELVAQLNRDAYGHLREVNRVRDIYEQEAEDFVYVIQKQLVYSERMVELTTGISSIEDLKPYMRGLLYEEDAKR